MGYGISMRLSVIRTSSAFVRRLAVPAKCVERPPPASMLPSTSSHWFAPYLTSVVQPRPFSSTSDAECQPPNDGPALRITPAAAEQLRRIAATDEHLRVSVDSGGCSGFEYKLTLDKVVNPDDEVIELDGAGVVVDKLSLGFIRGSKLDFVEDMMRSAFRITDNPAATQGCSCGSSFAPKFMA